MFDFLFHTEQSTPWIYSLTQKKKSYSTRLDYDIKYLMISDETVFPGILSPSMISLSLVTCYHRGLLWNTSERGIMSVITQVVLFHLYVIYLNHQLYVAPLTWAKQRQPRLLLWDRPSTPSDRPSSWSSQLGRKLWRGSDTFLIYLLCANKRKMK